MNTMTNIPLPPRAVHRIRNENFAELLTEGLKRLWDGQSDPTGKKEFICNTFHRLPNSEELQTLIQTRLSMADEQIFTFGLWAEQFGVFTLTEIQAARRAWMLDLIDEFS